jgi:Starch-binding associating with outer membrane
MIKKRQQVYFFILFAFFLGTTTSCTKNFTSINAPWNSSPNTTVPQLYVGFISNLALGGLQVGYNSWVYPITQQGAVYTRADYSYGSDGSADWSNFYHNLANYNAMMSLIATLPDTAIYTNVKAMMKTLRAYHALKLSNEYGDMPYSDAGKAIYYGTDNFTPKYDKQQSIYLSVLNDLKWAVDNFSATDATQYSLGNQDLVLQNNISQWIEFANTLRLRTALTMYGKDPTDAAPQITDALTHPLLDADNTNVGLYPANIPNMDLSARQYSFGTECRLRMGTTMWEWMSSTNALNGSGIFDPRCSVFFEPNNDTLWNPFPQNPTPSTPAEGGDPYNKSIRTADWANKNGNGTPPTVNLYADFNFFWSQDLTIPDLFLTAAQAHFLKAEAYAIGAGVTASAATAQTEYNAGATESVNFWVAAAMNSPQWVVNQPTSLPSPAQITAFLTNPVVLFDVANPTTHGLQQIYGQEWIDLFRQPWEAWTLLRRTGGLTPMDPNNASYYTSTYGNYQRYQYPSSELTYNSVNYIAETGGSDSVSTKIWIAK